MNARKGLTAAAGRRPAIARLFASVASSIRTLQAAPAFLSDWRRYQRLPGSEQLRLLDADPRLADRLSTTPYDAHYLHQGAWAAERVFSLGSSAHVDVGSQLLFVSVLAARVPVTFVDIRPPELSIPNLQLMAGDILQLPFPDRSVASLSCLHVVEHVGLGRYGDTLSPDGSRGALAELQRVLEPGGSLFLSLPIGQPRVCFNAHRIHDPREIVARMHGLQLREFSAVDDDGQLRLHASLDNVATLSYGCGLFWFVAPDS